MAISPFARDLIRKGLEGLAGDITSTQKSATNNQFEQAQNDWRVRLSLAENSTYLYNQGEPANNGAGILEPLRTTKGVIFPYTPQIQISYASNYEPTEPTHSNYKIYQYRNSSVDQISITATFTAQDTEEANYLLAVIHFFRSVTKMFYGQDQNLIAGTPPPLCFLTGLGTFQFNNHPLVISNFNYTLPDKVDYIRAQLVSTSPVPTDDIVKNAGGGQTGSPKNQPTPGILQQIARLGLALLPGGEAAPTVFSPPRPGAFSDATYVPTQMQIQLTALPIVSRNTIRDKFSLQGYANGDLIKKGIW